MDHSEPSAERSAFFQWLIQTLDLEDDEFERIIFDRICYQLKDTVKVEPATESLADLVPADPFSGEHMLVWNALGHGARQADLVETSYLLVNFRDFWAPGPVDLVAINPRTGMTLALAHDGILCWGKLEPDFPLKEDQISRLHELRIMYTKSNAAYEAYLARLEKKGVQTDRTP